MHKITRFRTSSFEGYGLLDGDTIHELDAPWSTGRGRAHALADVRMLAACAPSKIVCVGRNYLDHAKELGNEAPAEPLIFLKPPSSLIASGDSILYPALSENVHYEGELGVVIGARAARHVAAVDALDYVFGYTCVNDVTARDRHAVRGWAHADGLDRIGRDRRHRGSAESGSRRSADGRDALEERVEHEVFLGHRQS